MNTVLRPMLVLFAALTLLTGVAYPLLVAGIGAWLFPEQVNGSLVTRDGVVVGSSLISQSFQDPKCGRLRWLELRSVESSVGGCREREDRGVTGGGPRQPCADTGGFGDGLG